jgi:hypothetical protein
MAKREHVSVPLDPELRQYAERAAAEDDRTVAAWIRHLIAEAARRSAGEQQQAALRGGRWQLEWGVRF